MQDFDKPQVCNTGANWTKQNDAAIDWFTATFDQSHFFQVMADTAEFFCDEFQNADRGIGWYSESWRSTLGAVIGRYPKAEGRVDAMVQLPGKLLATRSPLDVALFLGRLRSAYQAKASRLDVRIDDYSKTVTPDLAYEAVEAGNFTGFHADSYTFTLSGSKDGCGKTLSLGKRGKKGSGKYLRIYDKGVESKGEIDATRIELELSRSRSRELLEIIGLLTDSDSLNEFSLKELITSLISGAVDFIERDSSGRADRSTRLSWWAYIVEGVERLALATPRVVQTLDRWKSWFKSQVAPVLAAIFSAGSALEWFTETMEEGERRMKDRHYFVVDAYLRQLGMQHL